MAKNTQEPFGSSLWNRRSVKQNLVDQNPKISRLQLDGTILKEFVTKISFQIQIFSLAAFVPQDQLNHIWH
jgi:hypothetical protein